MSRGEQGPNTHLFAIFTTELESCGPKRCSMEKQMFG